MDNITIPDKDTALRDIGRKLASVQKIDQLTPIENAEKIETALVQGWECVVKKGDFKVGDLIVYFEVDSILPEKPEFEFLRDRKFRIKTIRLRKQISQGLVMPLSILPDNANRYDYVVGDDVTEILGVTKHDPQLREENELANSLRKASPVMRFLMGIAPFRWVYLKLNTKFKGNFPDWIQKTDQTRIQTCAKILMEHFDEPWYITEKCDGSSSSFFTYLKKVWGIHRKQFGVASRNIWLKSENKSNYWEIANKFELKKKFLSQPMSIVCQGEICGAGIQKNRYKIDGKDLYVFNVICDGRTLGIEEMEDFCKNMGLKTVPVIDHNFIPSEVIGKGKEVSEIVKHMVTLSQGNSELLERKREGIICCLKSNPNISFKVINPYYLLETDE